MAQLVEPHKDDAALVRRAMRNLHNLEPVDRPKWVVVMRTFGLGSTESSKLCRRMGMNPEAVMSGVPSVCSACGETAVDTKGLCCACGAQYED